MKYIEIRIVDAVPTRKSDANKISGFHISGADEDGYLVTNDDGSQGWCSKNLFYKHFVPYDSELKKLIVEYDFLKKRINELDAIYGKELFKGTDDDYHQKLKKEQLVCMENYFNCLLRRINYLETKEVKCK